MKELTQSISENKGEWEGVRAREKKMWLREAKKKKKCPRNQIKTWMNALEGTGHYPVLATYYKTIYRKKDRYSYAEYR